MPDRALDLGLIVVYLIIVTLFGARFGRNQKSLKDYFLGGRSAPWWAIALSIVAAETSTLTIIGTPALAFRGDLGFLQIALGYLLARVLISAIFLPAYWRGEMYTAYELMRRRFGERLRRITASTFLVTRSLAEGVRVFAISLVVSVVLETGEMASILIITLLTLFYTFHGGMAAVIWTDVVQMLLYVSGALLSFWMILQNIPGGWPEVAQVAEAADKFRVFHFGFAPTAQFFSETYTFWAGLLGGCFLTTATHGTDQLVVQRLLSARNQQEARLALLSSWVVIFLQFTLFLVIGVMLYVYYQASGLAAPDPLDRLYPAYIWERLPPVASGIVTAAILAAAMANIAAALNSLASTTMMDLALPLFGDRLGDEQRKLRLSKMATLGWGVALMTIAWAARNWGSVLEAGLAIASVPLGALLGVFSLGVLTRRATENGAIIGMLAGLAVILYVTFGTNVAWTWYVVVGSLTTFTVGWLASLAAPEPG
ncbi:MAG: sodium/solute symporter [Bryobacterales bacterium]|nr:sodium:solute symporter [Acidobacteriota bacterium]MCB9384704.1 sodium/solute symporter [Bryobacterales bacterium]